MFDLTKLVHFATSKGLIDLNEDKPFDLPYHFYIKDTKGNYLDCNDEMANFSGLSSSREVIGLSDFEIVPETAANMFRKNDQEVMHTCKHKLYFERMLFNNNKVLFISQKAPLFSKTKKVIGSIGLSLLQKEDEDEISKYGLSKQQYACLTHFIKGLSAKQIAKEMKISPRTVEHHILALKTKLNCQSRDEIMEKAFELKLLVQYL